MAAVKLSKSASAVPADPHAQQVSLEPAEVRACKVLMQQALHMLPGYSQLQRSSPCRATSSG